MAQSYTRQSTFADGDTITAALFNDEYNQLLNAFAYSSSSASSTGHRHDGSAGQGGNIPTIGDLDFLNKITVDGTNNRIGFFVEVSSSAVEQIRVQDGAVVPVTDDDIDLGTSSLEFKDLYIDGTAYVDAINFNGTAITATAAELNILDGVTATASELNILDGVTSTTAELNILDGVTSTTAELNILDGVTSTAAELNVLDGITAVVGELNALDLGSTAIGTGIASKAVVLDANKDYTGIRNLTIEGDLTISGDDLFMATNTAGHLLIADGTNFNPTAVGDLSEISTVANDDVLLAVDTSGGGLKKIQRSTLVAGLATSGAISNVVEDTTPQLGGDLDMNGQDIVTTSNADLELAPNGTGHVTIKGNTNSGAIQFNCENNSHGQIVKAQPHSAGVTNELLLPAGGNSTLVSEIATQTLTNKRLTSPKLNEDVAISATATELNVLDGITSTTTELNILDGVTSTAAELNLVDGSSAGTIVNSKAVVYGSSGEVNATTLQIAGTSITSTAAELNILDGVTATTAELNYTDGVTSNIQTQLDAIKDSTFTATASGALSNGDTVIINSDGTVTAVGTSVSALNPPTKGTAVEFEAGGTAGIAAVFDPDNNKVIVAYSDAGDSDKGKAVVGTVSGTSISFGTPVEFEAGNTSYIAVAYDTNADRVVIAYSDNDFSAGAGTAIVGTVSGTSISFGSVTVFNNAETNYIGITFDSSNNKVVIVYRDSGNSNYGTAVVGTVSGTSISFDAGVGEIVFNSGNTFYASATFDSNANKVVVAYRDQGDSNKGKAIVGTVSGTSISFGTPVVFDGNNGSEWTAATFDSSNNKVVIFYQDDTDTETNAIVGTVSGTSISFGTAVQVLDGNNVYHNATFDSDANTVLVILSEETTEDIELFVGTVSGTSISFGTALKVAEHAAQVAVVYDTNAQKGVVLYDDDDDSSKGKGVVTTVNGTTTNLTPENYVGISNGAYSNSATATIQISGSVDDAQSSLTAGQVYYVQGDGSLGLKPDVPAVVAGIAVSSTKLMLELSKEPAVTEQNSTAITSSSNAATINLRDGDNFTHTLTENVTYTFSNPAASGRVSAFSLKVVQDSSARTITWPSSVDWAAATAPTLSTGSGNVDVFVFVTYDGGTNYYGFTAGQAMA